MRPQIISTISMAWNFTTKSGGIWEFQDALDRIKYIEKKLGIESGV
jgi:hypothetical protein